MRNFNKGKSANSSNIKNIKLAQEEEHSVFSKETSSSSNEPRISLKISYLDDERPAAKRLKASRNSSPERGI